MAEVEEQVRKAPVEVAVRNTRKGRQNLEAVEETPLQ